MASIREKKTGKAYAPFLPSQPALDIVRDRALGQMDLHAGAVHPFFCIFEHLIQPLSALHQGLRSKAAAVV